MKTLDVLPIEFVWNPSVGRVCMSIDQYREGPYRHHISMKQQAVHGRHLKKWSPPFMTQKKN